MPYTAPTFIEGAGGNLEISIAGNPFALNVQKWVLRYMPIPSNVAKVGQLGSRMMTVDLEVNGSFEGKVNSEVVAGYMDKMELSGLKFSMRADLLLLVTATVGYVVNDTVVQIDFLRDKGTFSYSATFSGGEISSY